MIQVNNSKKYEESVVCLNCESKVLGAKQLKVILIIILCVLMVLSVVAAIVFAIYKAKYDDWLNQNNSKSIHNREN